MIDPRLLPPPETIGRMVDDCIREMQTADPVWALRRTPEEQRREMAPLMIAKLRRREWADR